MGRKRGGGGEWKGEEGKEGVTKKLKNEIEKKKEGGEADGINKEKGGRWRERREGGGGGWGRGMGVRKGEERRRGEIGGRRK
mgnify:CR=1 FL=1